MCIHNEKKEQAKAEGWNPSTFDCSICYGTGKVSDGYEDYICRACKGSGCSFGCEDCDEIEEV
jgi:hypothetical protein